MKKPINRVLTGLAAAGLTIATLAVMPAPAQAAADTYTPHGGPDAVLISNHIAFTFVEAGQMFA